MEDKVKDIEEKLILIENKQIEQNRNVVSIIRNLINHGFNNDDQEKLKASWIALGGYFLRQRIFLLITSMFTIVLAGASLCLAWNANNLMKKQNILIDKQSFLMEAERNASLNYLLGNILNSINSELEKNEDNLLSDQLINQIIVLSNNFRPYRFYSNEELNEKLLSPERGQLFSFLGNSRINKLSLDKIYRKANFKSSYLDDANLSNGYFQGADLRYSTFKNSKLNNSILNSCILDSASFENAFLFETKLSGAILKGTNFNEVTIIAADFDYSLVSDTLFFDKITSNTLFKKSQLGKISDEYCIKKGKIYFTLPEIGGYSLHRMIKRQDCDEFAYLPKVNDIVNGKIIQNWRDSIDLGSYKNPVFWK